MKLAGWWRPGPWMLALAMMLIFTVLWLLAVNLKLQKEQTASEPS